MTDVPDALVILDRDGVINVDSTEYIKSPEEWCAIPGSLEAIARLNCAGCTVVVATNQSGVGRGYYSLATLDAIHQKMHQELARVGGHVDRIYYCPHTPEMDCACRKPKPGLLWQIKRDFSVLFPDLFSNAILVGDALRDIQAAHAVHCSAVLVKTGKGEQTILAVGPESGLWLQVPIYTDLAAWVDAWLPNLRHP